MHRHRLTLAVVLVGWLASPATAAEPALRELRVHLVQANVDAPYAFVRAKFEPGEATDPWAVRFVDAAGTDIPYFVWDSMTWDEANDGRPDWGNRYAAVNHAPGDDPEVRAARDRKLEWAKNHAPDAAMRLEAERVAAVREGESLCAVLYLLKHRVAPLGKERITLQIHSQRQVEPARRRWTEKHSARATSVEQGDLGFHDLPDRLRLTWRGKELLRYAGFDAGQATGTTSHVDTSKPFTVETTSGIITKLTVHSQTAGRDGGDMHWQCTYWLFPEGGCVALEGFSLDKTEGYIGGVQKLSLWQTPEPAAVAHEPLWETPWWLHRVGDRGHVATHLFHSVPLTVGYGNNPFTVNSMAPPTRAATIEQTGDRLSLQWHYSLDDLAISRLFAPELYFRLGHGLTQPPEAAKNWLDNNREVVASGKVAAPPEWMTPTIRKFVEEQLQYVRWQPKTDWFYRQYVVGLGERADEAESAVQNVTAAAAGWIDRPFGEEELAGLLAETIRNRSDTARMKWSREMEVLPSLLNPDPAGLKQALARWPDQVAVTDTYIQKMENNKAQGGHYLTGNSNASGGNGEGWIVNPSYHATQLPYYVRFLQHFELPYPEQEYREAILRFADYSLGELGGNPLDYRRLRESYDSQWPSRFVAVIPLMLAANNLRRDERYSRAATIMFDVVDEQLRRNPQGYWSPWVAAPEKAEPFDTVYNGAGVQRGLPAFWTDGRLDLIGRERAAQFVSAQARYFVASGQLLDTLEVDNVTAVYATKHGGHPSERKQIPLFLYDDFEFYRGLVGNLIYWAAATPAGHGDFGGGAADRELGLAESGCYGLRWALGIDASGGGGKSSSSRWFEHRLDPLGSGRGCRVRVWNRLPWPESTLSIGTRELLPLMTGEKTSNNHPALWLRFDQPAYREPLTIDLRPLDDGGLAVDVSRDVTLRLYPTPLCPNLSPGTKLALARIDDEGQEVPVVDDDGEPVRVADGLVEWEARPGSYRLRPTKP